MLKQFEFFILFQIIGKVRNIGGILQLFITSQPDSGSNVVHINQHNPPKTPPIPPLSHTTNLPKKFPKSKFLPTQPLSHPTHQTHQKVAKTPKNTKNLSSLNLSKNVQNTHYFTHIKHHIYIQISH